MYLEDCLDTIVARVKQARAKQQAAKTIKERAMWANYHDGYVSAVTDIFGLGAALRIERRIAGRADDETA
jgi:hypothetical protein